MSKQDRVFTRTAAALEQKLSVKKNLNESAVALTEQRNNLEAMRKWVEGEIARLDRLIDGVEASAVLYTEQELTDEQKAQARTNIDAESVENVRKIVDELKQMIDDSTAILA